MLHLIGRMTNKSFESLAAPFRLHVDEVLTQAIYAMPAHRLRDAMAYALLNGGKRVRPLLVLGTNLALGGKPSQALSAAAAIECIHAYSLIHDDLPAMDDDHLRRGKPTCHIAFDDATAILAGDALQAMAFELLAQAPSLSDKARLAMVSDLSRASGAYGMVAGQAIDLASVNTTLTLDALETMHRLKTGALIDCAVTLGCLSVDSASNEQTRALSHYAQAIGLAFQVQDDILDVTSDTETLGKTQGADQALNKPTYVSLLGLSGAQKKVEQLYQNAIDALALFGPHAELLESLARYVVKRHH